MMTRMKLESSQNRWPMWLHRSVESIKWTDYIKEFPHWQLLLKIGTAYELDHEHICHDTLTTHTWGERKTESRDKQFENWFRNATAHWPAAEIMAWHVNSMHLLKWIVKLSPDMILIWGQNSIDQTVGHSASWGSISSDQTAEQSTIQAT